MCEAGVVDVRVAVEGGVGMGGWAVVAGDDDGQWLVVRELGDRPEEWAAEVQQVEELLGLGWVVAVMPPAQVAELRALNGE